MSRQTITTVGAPKAIGPYAQAVIAPAGRLLFCSGQIPIDPKTGEMVGAGDVRAQTERVLENLGAVLSAAGASFASVVKTTIFLADLQDFGSVNEVYARYFPGDPPGSRHRGGRRSSQRRARRDRSDRLGALEKRQLQREGQPLVAGGRGDRRLGTSARAAFQSAKRPPARAATAAARPAAKPPWARRYSTQAHLGEVGRRVTRPLHRGAQASQPRVDHLDGFERGADRGACCAWRRRARSPAPPAAPRRPARGRSVPARRCRPRSRRAAPASCRASAA